MACETAPCPTSLDHHETSVGPPEGLHLSDYSPPDAEWSVQPIWSEEAAFRHSGWVALRRRVWDSLKRVGSSANRLDRFSNCGSGCCVQHHAGVDRWRLAANYCRDRLCIPCGAARAAKLVSALQPKMRNREMRFITLSMRHNQTPLVDQLKRLQHCFRLLRQRKDMKPHLAGGAFFIEVKRSRSGRAWHPHLHILVEGGFLSQQYLSDAWHSVTGDSYIVDIRKVQNNETAALYVTKYATKPVDSSVFAVADWADEFAIAIRCKRLHGTFGNWSKLKPPADDADPKGWRTVGSLCGLLSDAAAGDAVAQSVLSLICKKRPLADRLTYAVPSNSS